MNDDLWLFFGCSLLAIVPVALVIVLVVLYRGQRRLGERIAEQGRELEALRRLVEGTAPVAGERVPPVPAEPEPAAHVSPAERESVAPEPVAPASLEVEPAAVVSEPAATPATDRRRVSVEELVWTRLPVWIGAIALALAGAYMVKLSFERGWISPPVRVTLGALFGTALLVGGEWIRRSNERVGEGLAAAGIAALYAAFYAAHALYALVPLAVGFALLALVTAVAIGLSLRRRSGGRGASGSQGALVALVGLVGGFATPALVSSDTPHAGALFAYLALLIAGLVTVSRRRDWGWLGAATLLGALGWVFVWIGGAHRDADTPIVGLFLLVAIAVFALRPGAWRAAGGGRGLGESLLGSVAGAGALVAAGRMARIGGHGWAEWAVVALVAAGCLAVARLGERGDAGSGRTGVARHGLAWLALVWSRVTLASWFSGLGISDAGAAAVNAADGSKILTVDVALTALFVAGGWVAHRGSRFAGSWASLAATAAVVGVLQPALERSRLGLDDVPWGLVSLGVALLLVVLTLPVARRRGRGDAAAEAPLAALALGVTTLVALAAGLELERAWLSVAWALQLPVVVWLAGRLRLPALFGFAWLLIAVVGVRLALNPAVVTYPIGDGLVVNWLLYGYGVSILAVVAAIALWVRRPPLSQTKLATTLETRLEATLGSGLGWLFLGLVTAYALLETRQVFHPGDLQLRLGRESLRFAELGTYPSALFALAFAFLEGGRALGAGALGASSRALERVARRGARLLAVLGLFAWTLPAVIFNPLHTKLSVGTWIVVDRLAWAFLVPAALALLVARSLGPRESGTGSRLAASLRAASLFGLFLYVTLEILHLFRGAFLTEPPPAERMIAESWAVSIAWIVLGVALALGGVLRGGRLLRWGSLAVLVLAIGKVFLVDTASLGGFYRVLSLVGLGLSLIGLAYLYQRLVFAEPATPDDPQDSTDDR